MVSYPWDKGSRWSFNRWLFRRGKRPVHPRNKTANGYQHLTQLDGSFESVSIGEKEKKREREKGESTGLEQQNQCIVNVCRLVALSVTTVCAVKLVESFPFLFSFPFLCFTIFSVIFFQIPCSFIHLLFASCCSTILFPLIPLSTSLRPSSIVYFSTT